MLNIEDKKDYQITCYRLGIVEEEFNGKESSFHNKITDTCW